MLQIFNNFLSEKEISDTTHVIDNLWWKYGEYSLTPTDDVLFWIADLDDKILVNIFLDKLEEVSKKKFELIKVHVNGQTYGQDGSYHKDHEIEGMYTFLIYMSPITQSNINYVGGYTQFIINDMIVNVEPFCGRGVLFDSRILHRGMAPLLKNVFRISIAIKLKEIK
jgi:hypothetical protein